MWNLIIKPCVRISDSFIESLLKKSTKFHDREKYPASNQRNIPVAAQMAQSYLKSQNGWSTERKPSEKRLRSTVPAAKLSALTLDSISLPLVTNSDKAKHLS